MVCDHRHGKGPIVYAETPRRLVLVGELDTREIESLTNYCRRLAASGQRELHLDLAGVTDCQRSGLIGLLGLLVEPAPPHITVEGAHWGQFMLMLGKAPVVEMQQLCDSVRTLLHAAGEGSTATRASSERTTTTAHVGVGGLLHDA
jgi:hypothetical protein